MLTVKQQIEYSLVPFSNSSMQLGSSSQVLPVDRVLSLAEFLNERVELYSFLSLYREAEA